MATKTKTRRAPGSGHLFTRTDKAERDSWYGKWYSDGQQVKRRIGDKRQPGGSVGMTRAQAERELRKAQERAEVPRHERISVEVAGRRLVENREAGGCKISTVEAYRSILRTHLVPFFGDRSLESINKRDVEAFMLAKRREGKSPKTVSNALVLLYSIFSHAEENGWAMSNPCKHVARPKATRNGDIRFLKVEEVLAAVRAERDRDDALSPTLALVYLTAATTGLRMGELIGLRWRDVDWSAGRLRVRQAHVRGEFTTPKSRRGSRSVPLTNDLSGGLDRHSQATRYRGDDDLVFCHPVTGRPLDRSKARKRFKKALSEAGVREVRFHDLRHTFGTRMAGAGVPMRTLQEWMGHGDVQTTQIYADYSPSAHEREWVEAAFSSSPPSGTEALAGR